LNEVLKSGRRLSRSYPALLALVPSLLELWTRRELLWHMTVRNLRAQHKQSVLGYAWLVVNPVTQLIILTFVFSTIFGTPSQGHPFVLFLALGLFPWIFFSSALSQATDSVVLSANLLRSVYFPRHFLVVSAVMIRTVDFFVGLMILAVALVYFSVPLSPSVAWVPLLFALQFLFIVGLSLPLAAINLFFHDVRFLVGVFLNLWFFLTPIFYPVSIVPEQYRVLYELNPMARLIGAYREALLFGVSPQASSLVAAALTTLFALFIGYYLFQKMEPRFADRA
jgi:lipopolysaccharide transport system permease protein